MKRRPLSFLEAEPAVAVGLVQGVVNAFVALVVVSLGEAGVHLSDALQGAILGFLGAVFALASAFAVRARVSSTKALEALAPPDEPAGPAPAPPRRRSGAAMGDHPG